MGVFGVTPNESPDLAKAMGDIGSVLKDIREVKEPEFVSEDTLPRNRIEGSLVVWLWVAPSFPVVRHGTEPDRPSMTSGRRSCGHFVWADGEEDESMTGRVQCETKVDQVKINLGCRVSKLETEIRVLKYWIVGLSMVMLFGIVGNGLGLGK
ncbi:hypothetical protein PIB30_064646 [Stylosanthes scabra]|uniref:Uncharacterized protein n=1 Tax=Stylosanthes scabra TaxID=79078 RepID=A0ABU6YK01_9FABA|nr:hypothetical protein [Stylosanthes scabra]